MNIAALILMITHVLIIYAFSFVYAKAFDLTFFESFVVSAIIVFVEILVTIYIRVKKE